MRIDTVGIFMKPGRPDGAGSVRDLTKYLGDQGIKVLCDADSAAYAQAPGLSREEIAATCDLAVVLGGDGTLLSVARAVGSRSVPILGVNLGTLGFLTEVSLDELLPAMAQILAGEVQAKPRLRLEAVVIRGDTERGRFLALNDAVVTKTALSRIIDLEAFVNGESVTTFHADGLIASTPTGSTAYSLSAGGPFLMPGSGVIVLTPISPHSLTQRPFVFPQSATLEIAVDTRGGQAALTVDGQEGMDLIDGDRVRVSPSVYPLLLISSPFRNHFEILREKLRWGER
jgi:NAD+ kinase